MRRVGGTVEAAGGTVGLIRMRPVSLELGGSCTVRLRKGCVFREGFNSEDVEEEEVDEDAACGCQMWPAAG